MKVSQMPYKRVAKDEVLAKIKELTNAFAQAKTLDEAIKVIGEFDELKIEVMTMYQLAYIRFSQNTKDEFYVGEQDFWDEFAPGLSVAVTDFNKNFVTSPLSPKLREKYPPVLFKNIELQMKASDERAIPYEIEQNKLISQYTRLVSNILIEFNGEKLPPSGMAKYSMNPDRKLRKGASMATGAKYMEHAAELDEIYDKLVSVRTKAGKELGYETYSPLGYAKMTRNCYGKEDIAKLRENVKKHIVPLVGQLKERIRKEQGWDKVMNYDENIYTKEEPKPIGTPDEIFENGKKMYGEMMPVADKLFRKMCDIEAFDALSREGKWGGGYCITIDKYKTPFILANFNGTSGDIDVLTHEFGHALAADRAFEIKFPSLREPTMETAEVHSMSMEFLAYPWMEMFFGDKTPEYKFSHMAGALAFLPYGVIVDYFQQTVYDNPGMTPAERIAFWQKIEKEFLPHMHSEGVPFYGEGRRWQRQSHIYEVPFYYIDYCLAQLTAFQIFSLMEKDYKKAQETYMAFLVQGGTKPFTELLASVGLKSPFEEETFVDIANAVKRVLKI